MWVPTHDGYGYGYDLPHPRVYPCHCLIIVNWPLSKFQSPSNVGSMMELNILYNAWKTGSTTFCKMTQAEWEQWDKTWFEEALVQSGSACSPGDEGLGNTSGSNPPIFSQNTSTVARHLHGYTPGYQRSYPHPYPWHVGMGICRGYGKVYHGYNPWFVVDMMCCLSWRHSHIYPWIPTHTHRGGMGMGMGIRRADPYPYPHDTHTHDPGGQCSPVQEVNGVSIISGVGPGGQQVMVFKKTRKICSDKGKKHGPKHAAAGANA
ncbi:hypothetical protein BU15DRAFT_68117 [Melanogaster broomeanus]|nr:hypothetical protein BU15DRAFT_68117 [Melanogaster broomeanus]